MDKDNLTNLPADDDVELTPGENEVISQMFKKGSDDTSRSSDKNQTNGWIAKAKISFVATLIFILLANPWLDALFCHLPWCGESPMIILGIKSLLFMILFLLTMKYAL